MRRAIICLVAVALALAATAALAGLDGYWTFSYRTPSGMAVTVPVLIEDEAGMFSANATYPLNGQVITDVIEGTVAPTGRVEFNVTRDKEVLPHRGHLSANGRVIRGWYSESAGPGTFVLDRGPMASDYPVLSGQWVYVFQEPNGDKFSAACTLTSRGRELSGTIRYPGNTAPVPLSGSSDRKGQVRFILHEAGREVLHTGLVSDDGQTITGRWHSKFSSGSFTITRQ